jgi:hypothetical protein
MLRTGNMQQSTTLTNIPATAIQSSFHNPWLKWPRPRKFAGSPAWDESSSQSPSRFVRSSLICSLSFRARPWKTTVFIYLRCLEPAEVQDFVAKNPVITIRADFKA